MTNTPHKPLSLRPYQGEDDFWRIRAFLREVFLLNDRHEYSWQAARLDYWRWHVVLNCELLPNIEDHISCGKPTTARSAQP